MITTQLRSEVLFPGTFQLQGTGDLANLQEFLAPPFPTGGTIPASTFPHGVVTPSFISPNANRLVHVDQPWQVRLDWVVGGIFAHAIDPNYKWEIEVLLEKWGLNEFELPAATRKIALNYGSGTATGTGTAQIITYPGTPVSSTTVSIPANAMIPGVYEVVVVLRLLEADGVTPCFLAAFAEFGKIDFYEGH